MTRESLGAWGQVDHPCRCSPLGLAFSCVRQELWDKRCEGFLKAWGHAGGGRATVAAKEGGVPNRQRPRRDGDTIIIIT